MAKLQLLQRLKAKKAAILAENTRKTSFLTRDEHVVFVKLRIEAAMEKVGSNGTIGHAMAKMTEDKRYAERMGTIAAAVNVRWAALESDPERMAEIVERLRKRGLIDG